ncbi:MAG TPA: sialidase family protein [Gaiellaceae bacterium]
MRRILVAAAVLAAAVIFVGAASSGPFSPTAPSVASKPSPFAPGCEGVPQSGTLYENAEVEPRVAVDPGNSLHIVGVFQQDRWSNGGAHGLVTSTSFDGGVTWTESWPHFSICSGGTVANGGDFERSSDPWASFSPNGVVHQISLSFNDTNADNAILASRSTDGGLTWSEPATLQRENRGSGALFVDKESITADPFDSHFVYAVWDRSTFPSDSVSLNALAHTFALRSQTEFARSTDNGVTWEPARPIFDEQRAISFTIGNQIVVVPTGGAVPTLVNGTMLFHGSGGQRSCCDVVVMRSPDRGVTWSGTIKVSDVDVVDVTDPDTGHLIRTGDIIPDVAAGVTAGRVYAVWQDGSFSGPPRAKEHSGIAFSQSLDGGLTWSPKIEINQAPSTQAFTPNAQVAADGTIGVTYYDFRNNTPAPGLPTDYWFVHCHPATQNCTSPLSWTSEAHVAGPFDMETAPNARGFFVGDYEGLARAGNSFVSLFAMANDGNLANRTDIFESTLNP